MLMGQRSSGQVRRIHKCFEQVLKNRKNSEQVLMEQKNSVQMRRIRSYFEQGWRETRRCHPPSYYYYLRE